MARLLMYWHTAKDSLWFIPAMLTLVSAALALGLTELERTELLDNELTDSWFFGGGAAGARGVLNAIAAGLITVTGVVFSVTVVALQLASSQFTPRVLRTFMGDRGNQLVLGVFIGTFTYSLLVMRSIRSPIEDQELFVPRISVTVAVLMVIASIGFLIYFIDHVAKSMQISVILERSSRQTLAAVERLFPEEVGHPDRAKPLEKVQPEHNAAANQYEVVAHAGGYLQAVDAATLFRIGEGHAVVIYMEPHIGDFLLKGSTLARVVAAGTAKPELFDAVRRAFLIGSERTPDQDVELGIIGLSDIAVRALSSANDPTTALNALDRLSEVALALGSRRPPSDKRTDDGTVCFVAKHSSFERAMGLAYDQICLYAADNPILIEHAVRGLTRAAALLPEPNRPCLLEKARHFLQNARGDQRKRGQDSF